LLPPQPLRLSFLRFVTIVLGPLFALGLAVSAVELFYQASSRVVFWVTIPMSIVSLLLGALIADHATGQRRFWKRKT
jgi:ABC-type enterochelin transport system permease subunit